MVIIVREIEKIAQIVLRSHEDNLRKKALWKFRWGVWWRVIRAFKKKYKEPPWVDACDRYKVYIQFDSKLYEVILIPRIGVFIYKYKEVGRYALLFD